MRFVSASDRLLSSIMCSGLEAGRAMHQIVQGIFVLLVDRVVLVLRQHKQRSKS